MTRDLPPPQVSEGERRCQDRLNGHDAFAAFDACHGLITTSDESRRRIDERLELMLAFGTDDAVQRNDPGASKWLLYYSRLPNADLSRLQIWREKVASRDKAAQRAAAEARAADRAAIFASPEVQAGVARLRARHERVIGKSADDLVATILDFAATFGALDAVIEGRSLRLMMDRPQLSDIANDVGAIADVFISWCNCDGVTEVWWDRTYVGGKKFPIALFRYDPNAEHSALVRTQP